MGLLWNISFIIFIFLIFLQNAWVHISGRVYRGDFGGLQLSHHIFILHQNDKLPKFCQQYRGGMRICFHLLHSAIIAYLWQLSCTTLWMKWRCSVRQQQQVSVCLCVLILCFDAELLSPMNVLAFMYFSPWTLLQALLQQTLMLFVWLNPLGSAQPVSNTTNHVISS